MYFIGPDLGQRRDFSVIRRQERMGRWSPARLRQVTEGRKLGTRKCVDCSSFLDRFGAESIPQLAVAGPHLRVDILPESAHTWVKCRPKTRPAASR